MNKKKTALVVSLCFIYFLKVYSQELTLNNSRKGNMYFYWGWNREAYTPSDIHFSGNDYDFTLTDVMAKDRQSKLNIDTYFNPTKVTIPQYNFRLGYFLNNHYNISFGIDHMKYVVNRNQTVKITGNINDETSNYQGSYNNNNIQLKSDFLKLEHTDGLNFINFDIRRFDQWYQYKILAVSTTGGIGAGILYPRTDASLLGKQRHDSFHLSGYGISAMIGLNFRIWKYFFIQTECKGGWINLPDILTTNDLADRAKQKFLFGQMNLVFGGNINL